jgi:hypothetical protein
MDAKLFCLAGSSHVLIKHKTLAFEHVLAPRYRTATPSFSKGECIMPYMLFLSIFLK